MGQYQFWIITPMILVLGVLGSVFFMRSNNLEMLRLRDAVIDIDTQTGDIAQIEPALLELRSHVFSHMNTSVRIELPGSFNAAVEQERQRVEQSGSANAGVYAQAQAQCERSDIPLTVRAQCIQEFVLANSEAGTDAIADFNFPPKEQFVYSFSAPIWSLDLAGINVLLVLLSSLAIISRMFWQLVIVRFFHSVADDPLR